MMYYNFYGKNFYYAEEEAEKNFLKIKTYRGHFNIDISNFLPGSFKDFKKLLEIIREDNEKENEHVSTLHGFISDAIELLEKFKNDNTDPAEKANYTGQLKKWLKLYNELAGRYNLEEKADADASVKCKKISVIPFILTDDNKKPKMLDGWKFEKYGMQFYAYKNIRQKSWFIVVPFCGLACNSYGCRNKNAAIASITPDLAEKIKNIFSDAEKAEEMRKRYAEYLEKYGFSYLLEDPLYNMPETGKPEEEAATMEETPETAQKAIVKPEKPEAEQDSTAAPEKPYTGNIEEFNRIYSRVYSVLYDHLKKSIPGQRIFYKNAISYFDNVLNMNSGGLLSAFIKYRKDFISSDREAAAFSIAYWIINGKTRDIPQNLLTMFIPLTPGRNAIKEHTSAYKKICYTVKRSRNISHITPYKPPEELRHGNYAIMAENVYIRHITQDRHIITMLPAWKSCICCGSQKTKRPYIDSS